MTVKAKFLSLWMSEPFEIELSGDKLYRVSEQADEKFVRLVGVLLDEEFSFRHHISHVKSKLSRINFIIARSKNFLPPNIRRLIYNSLVKSVLEFACVLYGAARTSVVSVLETMQKKIIRKVKGARGLAHTNNIFLELGVLKFRDLVEYNSRILGHGVWYKTLPENITSDFERIVKVGRETRAMVGMNLKIPFCGKSYLESAPCLTIPKAWNELGTDMKKHVKMNTFKKELKRSYFEKYRIDPKCTRGNCYSCART